MESNLGLNDWAAGARERRGAVACQIACLLAAVAITPFARLELTSSYPLFAMILGASIVGTTITGLLLLFQARALRSMPTSVLAAGFFFASATMIPYALTYPGMFPPLIALIRPSPATNGLLWFSWHAGLLAAFLIFLVLRRSARTDRAMRRRARGIVAGFAVMYLFYTAAAIWVDGLPLTGGLRSTWLFLGLMVPIIALLALAVVVATLRRRSTATVLDLWLGVVAVAILVDVYLTVVGAARFTIGWYASRIVMLFATGTVLSVLLWQAAQMYASLMLRAEILEGEAHTDILTGLPNRRRFDEEFARAFGSAQRRDGLMSIAIIDIDRFKLYNDAFGHQAGDDALHAIAQAIADSVDRSGDFAARYGGEEFVVILEDTGLDGAVGVGERIRNAVLQAGIRAPSGGLLSVSVGVATRSENDTAETLLGHADDALYAAKKAGRNRVNAWHDPSDASLSGS